MLKRIFDFVFSLVGLIVLSPLLLVVAALVYIDSGGPVLFKQERIGRFHKPFKILKFRTMRPSKPGDPLITVGGDSRITRIGNLLRVTKIDELPQLMNVLLGDMSFVGPRPEVEKYTRLYDQGQLQVLNVRPGITDPAAVYYKNESELLAMVSDPEEYYLREIMPKKLRMSLEYIRQANFYKDILVILATLSLVELKQPPEALQ